LDPNQALGIKVQLGFKDSLTKGGIILTYRYFY
jgi:hypothetical protein